MWGCAVGPFEASALMATSPRKEERKKEERTRYHHSFKFKHILSRTAQYKHSVFVRTVPELNSLPEACVDAEVTGHFAYWTVCLLFGHFAYWTLRLLVLSPTRHFAYWTVRLLDSSPTRHFAYCLDSSPTDCSSFYQQGYQSKIKSDV